MTITLNGTTGITTPAVTNNGAYTGDGISFADGTPANTLVTTTGGNVGIGTSSPNQILDIYQNSAAVAKIRGGSATNQGAGYYVWKTDNSGSLCAFGDYANQLGGTPNTLVSIYTSSGVPLVFAASGSERMRIDSSGNLLVGTTTVNGNDGITLNGVGNYIVAAGCYYVPVGGSNRDLFVDVDGYIGYVPSVRESKKDIQELNDTSWLYQLNPVSFKYRKKDKEGKYTEETDGGIQYGLIAEDVEQVRPDLCFYDEKDGIKKLTGIQYSKLTPFLLKAIQEQQVLITSQASAITALEARLTALETK